MGRREESARFPCPVLSFKRKGQKKTLKSSVKRDSYQHSQRQVEHTQPCAASTWDRHSPMPKTEDGGKEGRLPGPSEEHRGAALLLRVPSTWRGEGGWQQPSSHWDWGRKVTAVVLSAHSACFSSAAGPAFIPGGEAAQLEAWGPEEKHREQPGPAA